MIPKKKSKLAYSPFKFKILPYGGADLSASREAVYFEARIPGTAVHNQPGQLLLINKHN